MTAARLKDFGDVLEPAEALEPILAEAIQGSLLEWLTEVWAEKELAAVGAKPRRRAIFDGPPGVGKTTLAHHLAARLGLTMLAVRPEKLIDKYLGSTGANIGALFEAVRPKHGMPVLLFFDEFDALGHKRKAANSSAGQEQNNYINTLLQQIDRFDGFLIAATNFGAQIDPAIWRRFDMHVRLELPGPRERELILARYLAPLVQPAEGLAALAEVLDGASPALIRGFCEALKRQAVIGPKLNYQMDLPAVIDRLVASLHPHPELDPPRLWRNAGEDRGLVQVKWPMKGAPAAPSRRRP